LAVLSLINAFGNSTISNYIPFLIYPAAVFTGDLDQIHTPYLDKMSNGLSYLVSRFINEENFCFLNLRYSVRSRLAEQGAKLL
jgi:hypothetical protein